MVVLRDAFMIGLISIVFVCRNVFCEITQ